MEIKENFKITGEINLKILDKNKKLIREVNIKNAIMNGGFAQLAKLAGNVGSPVAFGYLALGTSSTAVSAAQTALIAEILNTGLQRVAATKTTMQTTQPDDTLQLTYTFQATGTKTVNEIGIFNDASAGVMLGRALTGALSLVNGNYLVATYKVKFA